MDEITRIRKIALPLLKPYICRMAVFGSVVRGEATKQSDPYVEKDKVIIYEEG